MAVDLNDLVDNFKREVSPPGTDLYPDATDASWSGSLTDAFWEIRLYGFLAGFEEDAASRGGPVEFGEGIVTPIGAIDGYDDPTGYAPGQDLPRDLQQLIILWAGWKVVLNQMQNLSSMFRAKAGPVEVETQHAASVLKTILDQLKNKIDFITANLSTFGVGTNVAAFDALVESTYNLTTGMAWWVRG